jgi:hypothetical protein
MDAFVALKRATRVLMELRLTLGAHAEIRPEDPFLFVVLVQGVSPQATRQSPQVARRYEAEFILPKSQIFRGLSRRGCRAAVRES